MRLRRFQILALLGLVLFIPFGPQQALGQAFGHNFGMGVLLGTPFGLNIKNFHGDNHAIDAALGLNVLGGQQLQLHSDYLWHFDFIKNKSLEMETFVGTGLALHIREENNKKHEATTAYIRVPIGLAFYVAEFAQNDAPVDLFIEASPRFPINTDKGVKVDIGIGARWYF